MKAIVADRYGGPEVMRLEDVPKPSPKPNQVLVEIRAAALNPIDSYFLRGAPMMRLFTGLFRPRMKTLGADIAGVVAEVGSEITRFKPGDEIYGDISRDGMGGFAEFAAVRDRALALKPKTLSFTEAAAVPLTGGTALQAVRDRGKVKAGDKVLVNGASGGVGTFAVQIAKAFGAEVTGVSSAGNHELLRSLGADHVVDYKTEDVTKSGKMYDVIIDMIGKNPLGDLRRALAPGGRGVAVVFRPGLMFRPGGPFKAMLARANAADLETLTEMIEAGKVKPVIDRSYSLAETPAAIAYLETKRAKGKIVVEVG
jgi:NADPH:quinone reductase-like Zn-dependent oxidoreductase